MNLAIQEFPPAADLLPFVQSYWAGDFNLNGEPTFAQSVVPNGCIELIIHLSDAHCSLRRAGDQWHSSPDFTLLGLYTQPYEVRFSEKVGVFGLRFHPDGIRQVFGVSPAEFLASYEDGLDVLGRDLRDFCRRIRELTTTEARISLADQYLCRQLARHHQNHDYTHLAMRLIRHQAGTVDYQHLTGQIPISDRQLQREFKNQYGITVTEYMRLARLNAIQRYMRAGHGNLTQLTYELDFSDQSHFIREFKHYVGLPPRKFLKHRERFIVNPGRVGIRP